MADSLKLQKQDESLATEWPGRKPEDGRLSHGMNMWEAEHLVRAVTHPYSGAFYKEEGKKVIVWSATVSETPAEKNFYLKDGYLNLVEFEEEQDD